ncbi:MAG TPA: hypothetical protein VMP11_11450 [Verrucomicrobiae bacterium]|nr:hypothetical protein [Verrucomicrobiae bacterium]
MKPATAHLFACRRIVLILVIAFAAGTAGAQDTSTVDQTSAVQSALEWLFTGRSPAQQIASRPVQSTTTSPTNPRMAPVWREFYERQYLQAYDSLANHQSPGDAEMRQWIHDWIDYLVERNYGGGVATNFTDLVERGDKMVVDANCTDPLFLTLAGASLNEMLGQVWRFNRAVNGYEHSQYKAYPQMFAAVSLANTLYALHKDHDRIHQMDASAKRLLKRAFEDGSIRQEDEPLFGEILTVGWGEPLLERNWRIVPPIVATVSNQFPWLALMVDGQCEYAAAWQARGGGYADTVTSNGWVGFKEHLARARGYFTRAYELRPDLALSASRMVATYLGDTDNMRKWFDRATTAQIDYAGAYNHMRWGLRPRWGGDPDAMLAFGVTAADTRRYDTDVPRKLLDSISDMQQELRTATGQQLLARDDIWPRVQQMYEGYVAEPTLARQRDGWRSSYAVAAYIAGKFDVARAQLEAINWTPWHQCLLGWGRDLSLMPFEVAARTSPAASQIADAEAAYDKGDLDAARQIYERIGNDRSLDDYTFGFIKERWLAIDTEQQLATGNWVYFLPESPDLAGWTVQEGKCSLAPDGGLDVETTEPYHMLFCRARVGYSFEVKGSFDVLKTSDGYFQGGIVFGLPDFNSPSWYGFRIKRNADLGDIALFGEGWYLGGLSNAVPLSSQTNSFDVRVEHCTVNVIVNDQPVFVDQKLPSQYGFRACDSFLGLGGYTDSNDYTIRYHDVQVRRILNQ